jgi:murein DD-endopeptidase MepM/ murein hydrolase activator NlpD
VGALLILLVTLWPACPAEGWITSDYGYRRHPISRKTKFHYGVDIANVRGTEVRTPWEGRVAAVRRRRGAGLHVVVASGALRVTLAHLDEVRVSRGDRLERGAVVGLMGRSGRATGVHLHVEVRIGRRHRDPRFALVGCPARP